MSYQEKRTITMLAAGLTVFIAYALYAFITYKSGEPKTNDLSFWAISMLVFMAIGVVIAILTQIALHIAIVAGFEIKKQISIEIAKKVTQELPQNCEMPVSQAEELDYSEFEMEDERDKFIALKAMKIGYIIAGSGFLIALILLALKVNPAIMLNLLFFAFGLASLSESMAHLYYYKRGV